MRLIYFSPVPWTSFAQRPHRFAECFYAQYGKEVLWVDPYPTRLPRLSDLRLIKSVWNGEKKVTNTSNPPWLTILRPRSLPIEPLPIFSALNCQLWNPVFKAIDAFMEKGECQIGIGKPSELALQALARYQSTYSIYDAMDAFPEFYHGLSRFAMRRRESQVAAKVTKISVSSTALAERFARHHAKVTIALNACSIDNLPALNTAKPLSEKPVLGYVGTIGEWFDWSLVVNLAKANPTMCIRLIGPVHVPSPYSLPDNIELLPACNHETAMKHMQEFAIGLIPFTNTVLTASVDPVKYYEYRALGLPVLSTSFGEMLLRNESDGVFQMNEHMDLAALVKKALVFQCKAEEVQQFRMENSWERRFESAFNLELDKTIERE